MMLKKIDLLIKLQSVDTSIKKVENEKNKIPSLLHEYEIKIKTQTEILETIKKTMLDKQLDKKNLELELANIEENIKKHNIEINSVKSNDRYKAVIDAIKSEKKAKNELEDKILVDFDDMDKISIELEKQKVIIKNLEIEFNKNKEDLNKTKEELENCIQKFSNQRKELEKELDDVNLLELYDRIRTHQGGFGIAEVDIKTSSCTACNLHLPFQKINDIISSTQPTLCENCSRILYVLQKN